MTLLAATALAGLTAAAQSRPSPITPRLSSPNSTGVAMGHYHFYVRDVAAHTRFWSTLGGVASKSAAATMVKLTDVLIVLTEGQASGISDGSVLNHVAFRVPSLASVEAAGLTLERAAPELPGIATTRTPDGERIELFDNTATNVWFTPDAGRADAIAERHSRPTTVPIASHHFHLYLPDDAAVAAAKAWYTKIFGATPGKRWRYDAVDVPGININFGVAPRPVQPTKGRMLDHVGFEITGLAMFVERVEAMGVAFDERYRTNAEGIGEARLTDPWGTSIELTEGLRNW